jgi:lipopolysaccharide biosynthesis glycosyltransferase
MHTQKFEVAPDQDYLNFLCKDKVKYAEIGWNKTPFPDKPFNDEDLKLIHYKLNFKPWHYDGVKYEKYFWQYAKKSSFYLDLLVMREQFTEIDKEADQKAFVALQNTAARYMNSEVNYKNQFRKNNADAI